MGILAGEELLPKRSYEGTLFGAWGNTKVKYSISSRFGFSKAPKNKEAYCARTDLDTERL